MFEDKTVVVVGAGGSAEFGLPTGPSVFGALLEEPLWAERRHGDSSFDLLSASFDEFLLDATGSHRGNEVDQFKIAARNSFENSIDMFAYRNPSFEGYSKKYTSFKIAQSMVKIRVFRDNWGDNYRIPEYNYLWRQPRIGGVRNWCAELVRRYTLRANSPDELRPNMLKIITFNYDCIIEDTFKFFLESSEQFSGVTNDHVPDVLHVFGCVPFDERVTSQSIHAGSTKLKFMREAIREEENTKIRNEIHTAKNIFLAGFACDPINLEILGIESSEARKFAINYDGNAELAGRLRKLGIPTSNIMSGSSNAPVSLGRACQQGFFSFPELV